MTKTYYKKENIALYYLVIILSIGLLIFGWTLVEYFAWQALFPITFSISKIIRLTKNPTTPAIVLNEEGIQLLSVKDTPFYAFSNIADIKMNSKAFNGHLKLKEPKKKIILDSVALDRVDQSEICAIVKKNISPTIVTTQT